MLDQIKKTMDHQRVDYERMIDDFGQVEALERRMRGGSFTLRDRVRGLLRARSSGPCSGCVLGIPFLSLATWRIPFLKSTWLHCRDTSSETLSAWRNASSMRVRSR